MKKWLALPLLVLLMLLGWIAAGPFMTVNAIREAIRDQDTAALSEHVDFPVLRQNLKAQFEDYLARSADAELQADPFGAIVLGLASRASGSVVDMLATPAGIGAVLEGRGLLHRIGGGGVRRDDGYAHAAPPDPLRDAEYGFDSPSRFTATVRNDAGDPVVFVLSRRGLRWKLDDIRLPLRGNAETTPD